VARQTVGLCPTRGCPRHTEPPAPVWCAQKSAGGSGTAGSRWGDLEPPSPSKSTRTRAQGGRTSVSMVGGVVSMDTAMSRSPSASPAASAGPVGTSRRTHVSLCFVSEDVAQNFFRFRRHGHQSTHALIDNFRMSAETSRPQRWVKWRLTQLGAEAIVAHPHTDHAGTAVSREQDLHEAPWRRLRNAPRHLLALHCPADHKCLSGHINSTCSHASNACRRPGPACELAGADLSKIKCCWQWASFPRWISRFDCERGRARARERERDFVCLCVRARVRACACVHACVHQGLALMLDER